MTTIDSPVWIPLWVVLATAIPNTITAFAAAMNARHLSRLRDSQAAIRDSQSAMSDSMNMLEKNTNSKMDKLLAAKDELRVSTNAAARAEGKLEGQASEW